MVGWSFHMDETRLLEFSAAGPGFPVTAEIPFVTPFLPENVKRVFHIPDTRDAETSDTMLGGLYWVTRDFLDGKFPGWEHAEWFKSLTLEPETSEFAKRNVVWQPSHKTYFLLNKSNKVTKRLALATRIGFPRFWGLWHFGRPARDVRNCGLPFRKMTLAMKWDPRVEQTVAMRLAKASLDEFGGTLIEAACGVGKTAIAIALAVSLRVKTLIVCPTRQLVTQMEEAIRKWTDDTTVGIGKIFGDWDPACDSMVVDLSDFVITTSASMSKFQWPASELAKFGTLVVDECHHIASKCLSVICPKVPCFNVIGLTATPDRRDGLQHALYWLLGPGSFRFQRIESVTGLSKTLTARQVTFASPKELIMMRTAAGTLNWANIMVQLSKDEMRNAAMTNYIVDELLRKEKRSKIVVLVLHRDHVSQLQHSLTTKIADDSIPVGILLGGVKDHHVASTKSTCRVIVATMTYLTEGFDDPELDTLVLGMPRGSTGGSLEQMIGRIERAFPGKLKPLIVDWVDPKIGPAKAMARARRKLYDAKSYIQESVVLSDTTSRDDEDNEPNTFVLRAKRPCPP